MATGGIRFEFDGRLRQGDSPDITPADSVIRTLLNDLMLWDKTLKVVPREGTPYVKGYPKFLVIEGITDYQLFNVDRLLELYSVDNQTRWKFRVHNYPGYVRVDNPTALVPDGIPNSTKRSIPGDPDSPRIQRQWDEMHHLSILDGGKLFVACSGQNSEEYWEASHQVTLNNTPGLRLFAINELPDADATA